MPTISLCMIVKNEETYIARCLDSVAALVDEIIIVDTGSTDRTLDIVSGYTSKVYSYPWKDDFSAARNESFSKATMDYCMWMDADDVIEESQRDPFLQLKQSLSPDTDIVMMKYHTSFDEAGKPSFSYFRERWIRNDPRYRWIGAVHEVIPPNGSLVYSDIAVCHKKTGAGDPDRNLRIYKKIIADGELLDPRQQYYMHGSFITTSSIRKRLRCWNSFLTHQTDGSKTRSRHVLSAPIVIGSWGWNRPRF